MPSLSILFAQIFNKDASNHLENNEKDDLASCGKAVFLLDNSRLHIHSVSQLHQHFQKKLCNLLRSTILLLKPGMDRIDKTCSKKVDPMPPICTCGYSIANGRWMMLGKAAYLFVLNAYFIFLSANIVLSLLQIPKAREMTANGWKKLRKRMIRNTLIVVVPSVLFLLQMVQ